MATSSPGSITQSTPQLVLHPRHFGSDSSHLLSISDLTPVTVPRSPRTVSVNHHIHLQTIFTLPLEALLRSDCHPCHSMGCEEASMPPSPHRQPHSPKHAPSKSDPRPATARRNRNHASRKSRHLMGILPLVLLTRPISGQFLHPRDTSVPLRVTNHCPETIWPAILTQSGVGPERTGFELESGTSSAQVVSGDWRGRVWGRTNCSFPSGGGPTSGQGAIACGTGDCGMFLECQGSVGREFYPLC